MQRHKTHRRNHLFPIILIVLIVITASSIVALFLRGFKIQNLDNQFKMKDLETPKTNVWLIKTQGYSDKLEAYKTGINFAPKGLGVYVLLEENKWTWVAGAYSTELEASNTLKQIDTEKNTIVKQYEIKSKKFRIDANAHEPCKKILNAIQNNVTLLYDLRSSIINSTNIKDLQLNLTTQYNEIKNNTEVLQKLNGTLQNDFLATIIYSANQCILSLQDVIFLDKNLSPSLAMVNTTLLKTIFSLDNF